MSTSSSSAARFLALVAGWLAMAWLLATIAAGAFDVWGLHRASGHMQRSACGEAICSSPEWQWKRVAFVRSDARTVVLGDSRAALGIDPADVAAEVARAPAFNLAAPGRGFAETAALAVEIMRERRADHVLLALDRDAFYRPARGAPMPLPHHAPDPLSVLATYATSRAALRAPVELARSGCCRAVAWRAADGCALPIRRARFRMVEADVKAWLLQHAVPCELPGCAEARYAANLEALREIAATAARTRTRLTLFLDPLPPASLDLAARALPAPDAEQWKRDVARVVAEGSAGGVAPPRDFAVFSPTGDDDRFLDFAHYSRELGRSIVKSLASEPPDRGFGARLGAGLEGHLEADRDAHASWIASHPDDVARNEQRIDALRALIGRSRQR